MPTKFNDVKEFFERISTLEARVESLMDYQKWQMALLAAIFVAVIAKYLR